MILAISQVTTLNSPFVKDLEDYAAAHCSAVELWLGKLEAYLDKNSVESAAAALREANLAAPVASFQGGLLTSEGEARREHWKLFRKRLELCGQLGVPTLVVAGDIHTPLTQASYDEVLRSLAEAAEAAAAAGVRLALEFQASATLANNLQSASSIVAAVGHPSLGLCLDMFHFYCGPSKHEDLGLLTPDNLFHVQLCDLAGQARELASDSDRILPGDGDFLLDPLVARLREIDYQGCVSVELMNPQIWLIPPLNVVEISMTALRQLLGVAKMD